MSQKRIAIFTTGSRGDVEPCVSLALKLMSKNFVVLLGADPNHEDFVKSRGVPYVSTGVDTQKILEEFKSGKDMNEMKEKLQNMYVKVSYDSWKASEAFKPDVVATHKSVFAGFGIAAKLGKPYVQFSFSPWDASGSYPTFFDEKAMADPSCWYFTKETTPQKQFANFVAHTAAIEGGWLGQYGHVKDTLKMDNLPKTCAYFLLSKSKVPVLSAWSPSILNPPDFKAPHSSVTGYWFMDTVRKSSWEPPKTLTDFLASGDKPVYIGFGSMFADNPDKVRESIMGVIKNTKQRFVLLGGWAKIFGEKDLSDDVFVINEVPHSWLLPKMKAAVIHGGAGTTGACLRAGIPTIIVAHISDQPWWGNLLYHQGVGTSQMHVKDISTENLTAAVTEAISNKSMIEKAKVIGESIAKEDGLEQAAKIIQRAIDDNCVPCFEMDSPPWLKRDPPMPSTEEDFLWMYENNMHQYEPEIVKKHFQDTKK